MLVDPNTDGKGNPGMVIDENMAGVRRAATGRYCLRSELAYDQGPVAEVSVDRPMPRDGIAVAVSDVNAKYCSRGEAAVATYIIINARVPPPTASASSATPSAERRAGMNPLASNRPHWAVLGAIIGALAIAGIAWADIPDSGVIHACYANKDGALRVIDTSAGQSCNSSKEASLDWSAAGPALYTDYGQPTTIVSGPYLPRTLATLTLPAGAYQLAATIRASARDDSQLQFAIVRCTFLSSGGASSLHQATADDAVETVYYDQFNFHQTMPMQGDIEITTGPTTVQLACSSPGDAPFVDVQGNLSATATGVVHAQ